MIDQTKYPFELDHGKCFNCQVVPNLSKKERDGEIDGSTWQKGVHLCSSCQWHCAMFCLETRREEYIKRELRSLEHQIYDLTGEWIYFDEKTPQQVLEDLEKNSVTTPEFNEVRNSLKQIIEMGFNKLVC